LSRRALQGDDLDDFAGYSDAAIETIAALLCEKHETPRDTTLGSEEEEEEENFKLDDDHQTIDDPQLLPAMTNLCLGALTDDLIDSFGKLQNSPEW
jgi:hypothetical protein